MLHLNRKPGERIVIGDGVTCPQIVITFTGNKGASGVISIEAPDHVEVWREELIPEEDRPPQRGKF